MGGALWIEQSRLTYRNGTYGKHTSGLRANQGAAGVDDGQSIAEFEVNLADNLYKLWNRLSSGSYFPPPVRRVDIPKSDGKTRPLGIPTVSDRIAQMVVKRHLEPLVEPVFHRDSYGYRPGKSALDAVGAARQRCWRHNWVLDLDIKGFFDSIDWTLLMRAVRKRSWPGTGWTVLHGGSRVCLLTGRCFRGTAGQWEPYERRRSSTVLRVEGVIPLRRSPMFRAARKRCRQADLPSSNIAKNDFAVLRLSPDQSVAVTVTIT